jgi:hypothetical protein
MTCLPSWSRGDVVAGGRAGRGDDVRERRRDAQERRRPAVPGGGSREVIPPALAARTPLMVWQDGSPAARAFSQAASSRDRSWRRAGPMIPCAVRSRSSAWSASSSPMTCSQAGRCRRPADDTRRGCACGRRSSPASCGIRGRVKRSQVFLRCPVAADMSLTAVLHFWARVTPRHAGTNVLSRPADSCVVRAHEVIGLPPGKPLGQN